MSKDQAYLEAEKKIREALKSGATELDLRSMKLTELPESISQLTQLKKLDLSWDYKDEKQKNQLTSLPDSLGQLTQLTELNLSNNQLTTLQDSLEQLTQLTTLALSSNKLTALPDSLGQLMQLQFLDLSFNQLKTLPDSLGQLTQLTKLDLSSNQLTTLPDSLWQLKQLMKLGLSDIGLTVLPEFIGRLKQLQSLDLAFNQLTKLPESFAKLNGLTILDLRCNLLNELPKEIRHLTNLEDLNLVKCNLTNLPNWINELLHLKNIVLANNSLTELPNTFSELKNLEELFLGYEKSGNPISKIPHWISQLRQIKRLFLGNCSLTDLPSSLAQLDNLENLYLHKNPLNPALQSAYKQGLDAVKAYLRSLENAESLYEAKLVLVGEGDVGKTTLLKALKGKKGKDAPKKNQTTTHGVEIDIHGLRLPHPTMDGVEIQLNAWDFGGQDVYRVTHQFFFSRRSLYLLVWEPRRSVQQCQVEDWLNMIHLRVGDEARVLIVSTYSQSGGHIARIDKAVFKQQYGDMIVGFHEVDSLIPDEKTGEMVGIAELKKIIAAESAKLEQMGMLFNNDWKASRDELIKHPDPRISYTAFGKICAHHGLSQIDTDTLAHLMHDLGYIVHYSDDERLRDDVVLQPQWLTKAIGFVLEDRSTMESEGILPDKHLFEVWHDHKFKDEPRYTPDLYPFFLRLMEKYDVSYRLPEERHSSLVAQHVPQVRPELPWLPEQELPENLRRIAMICAMEEDPPGLVPWMIVRTHDYAVEQGKHHLHWQKGMFLNHGTHGQAMLEKRGREFHVYAQATYPEYFMNILQETLQKLITDNWPGLEGRYRFSVPCPTPACKGRFNIQALRQFLSNGVREYPCQECFHSHRITKLLLGFEELAIDVQLNEINKRLAGLDSRVARYFMSIMNAIANEAKNGPRLFTLRSREAGLSPKQLFARPLELQLWCEAEGCQHPVIGEGKGVYQINQPREWFTQIAPYANFALKVLATTTPIAAPAINTFFGSKMTETLGIADLLDLAGAIIDKLPDEIKITNRDIHPGQMLSEKERSGILALHLLLKDLDPTQTKLGLHRVTTYTGDYRWLCKQHYEAWQPNIPDVIKSHD